MNITWSMILTAIVALISEVLRDVLSEALSTPATITKVTTIKPMGVRPLPTRASLIAKYGLHSGYKTAN